MKPVRRFGLACLVWLFAASCAPEPSHEASAPAEPEKPAAEKPPAKRPGEVSSISFDDFFALHQQGQALAIDARPAYHYQLGHIPGALNLYKDADEAAFGAMEGRIGKAIAEGKTVVVYCSGVLCADARTVARRIARRGHDATIFSGGWNAWLDAGLPTE